MDFRHIIQRKNVDYTDLSLMNMKNDPKYLNFGNVATYPIHIWAATYVLQKTE